MVPAGAASASSPSAAWRSVASGSGSSTVAVAVARAMLASDNIYDQMSGAGTLVEIGDKDALQFLADNLGHPEWSMMRSAIDTLLNVEHPAGLDVLYRYAAVTKDAIFMKFLAESCASRPRDDMGEFLMNAVELDDIWVRKHALQALAHAPLDEKESRLRAIAEDTERDATTRAYAYYGLIDTGARLESIEKLIEIANHWGDDAQEAAAVALGEIDSVEAKETLKDLREARTLRVQMAAMASEAAFGVPEAIESLVKTIATGKGLDPSVAAASLRRLPPPIVERITAVLFECCKLNSDVGTRLLESWADVEGDAGPVIEWGLNNDNPDIRMQAVWLIGERYEKAYLDRIEPLLEDPDTGIRGMASWSIVRLLGDHYEPGTET